MLESYHKLKILPLGKLHKEDKLLSPLPSTLAVNSSAVPLDTQAVGCGLWAVVCRQNPLGTTYSQFQTQSLGN